MIPSKPDPDADALVAMLDQLVASGTQHINLEVGDETRIQTINSTECGKIGACAVPNFDLNDDDELEAEEESDNEDF